MSASRGAALSFLLRGAPLFLFAGVALAFEVLSGKFLTADNMTNLLVQSAATAIVAIGQTFVLVTAGVDLSVGAVMFVAAAVAGKMALGGAPIPLVLVSMAAIGIACGAANAAAIVRLRMIPFVVTLAALFAGRGLGLWITETRAMNLPEGFLLIGTGTLLGVRLPIWIFGAVLAASHILLSSTPIGRRLYAIGQDPRGARKAGIAVGPHLAAVYIASGLCAALGGILSLAQLGAVSPTFGLGKEFSAIAAAIIGGTSLSGGRGSVLPGTVLGALLIQAIESGLVILNADPYLYPLITGCIIFAAVLTDSLRGRLSERLGRRKVRVEG